MGNLDVTNSVENLEQKQQVKLPNRKCEVSWDHNGVMWSSNCSVFSSEEKGFSTNFFFPKKWDLDNSNRLDEFEVIYYELKNTNKYRSKSECYRDALSFLKYYGETNENCKKLVPKYEKLLEEKELAAQKSANREKISFWDEKWTGHQIANLTGDNAFTDWLQNKDKVCTDGKDDGKLSAGQYALSFVKGLIGGIPKMMINHPLATVATVGIGAALTALTSGAILPVLGAIGVTMGVGMVGFGTYKTITAKTDGEAKMALETMGTGVTTTALSMMSAGKALDKAAEAGVKSAQVSKDANIFQKTLQMFKSIPECLTKSKEWAFYKLFGTAITVERPSGTTQVLEKGNLTKETLADGTIRNYENGIIKQETLANGVIRNYENGILKEEILPDGKTYTCTKTGHTHSYLSNNYTNYMDKYGSFAKMTAEDGSYRIIDNNTGIVLEEQFSDGGYKLYSTDGKLIETKEVLPNGGYKIYDANGTYTKGEIVDGNKTMFYKNGNLVSSREELPNGGYKLYDENGVYTEGKIVSDDKTMFYKDGVLKKELLADGTTIEKGNSCCMYNKDKDGLITEHGSFTKTTKPDGDGSSYEIINDETGELMKKGYVNHKTNAGYTEYYNNNEQVHVSTIRAHHYEPEWVPGHYEIRSQQPGMGIKGHKVGPGPYDLMWVEGRYVNYIVWD